jgi:hypothetical protein
VLARWSGGDPAGHVPRMRRARATASSNRMAPTNRAIVLEDV